MSTEAILWTGLVIYLVGWAFVTGLFSTNEMCAADSDIGVAAFWPLILPFALGYLAASAIACAGRWAGKRIGL